MYGERIVLRRFYDRYLPIFGEPEQNTEGKMRQTTVSVGTISRWAT